MRGMYVVCVQARGQVHRQSAQRHRKEGGFRETVSKRMGLDSQDHQNGGKVRMKTRAIGRGSDAGEGESGKRQNR